MRPKLLFMMMWFTALFLLLAACQTAQTALIAATPIPANIVDEAANATATTETTNEQTDAPLPTVSLETLVGTWRQFDEQAQGYNWLVISPDGTYQGKHGPSPETGTFIIEGTYSLAENVLSLLDPTDCPDGESYTHQFINQTYIRVDLSESTCDEQLLPESRRWQQFIE